VTRSAAPPDRTGGRRGTHTGRELLATVLGGLAVIVLGLAVLTLAYASLTATGYDSLPDNARERAASIGVAVLATGVALVALWRSTAVARGASAALALTLIIAAAALALGWFVVAEAIRGA